MSDVYPSLIVGLGNPGNKYVKSRHNVGFMVIDSLIDHFQESSKTCARISKSRVWKIKLKGHIIHLQKPLTFMNLSGTVVKVLSRQKDIDSPRILVICDDIDLPLGKIRLRKKGSSGGHNGLNSVITEFGTDNFNRLRIGIAPEEGSVNTSDYVLSNFTDLQQKTLDKIIELSRDAVIQTILRGMDVSMNTYNGTNLNTSDCKL